MPIKISELPNLDQPTWGGRCDQCQELIASFSPETARICITAHEQAHTTQDAVISE